MKKCVTIQELHDEIRLGNIDESKLRIILDNDCTGFYINPEDPDDEPICIKVSEAKGYKDIEPLYKMLFPKANVEWC